MCGFGGLALRGTPHVGPDADGRLEVLASDPDVGPNADGRLEVFWRAPAGNIQTTFETSGGWSGVVDFGGDLADF